MNDLTIFNKAHHYEFAFQMKPDMETLENILNKIKAPLILSYCGLEIIDFFISSDDNGICDDCINWIYDTYKEKVKANNIRDCMLKCAIEDEEWTKERNKDLTGIFYRKITLLPDVQNLVSNEIERFISKLKTMYNDLMNEYKEQEKENERNKAKWKKTHVYKKILPTYKGDGYIDAEYTFENGEKIRMVSRDVFDVGSFSYPKRLEGNEEIFNQKQWTELEIQLNEWLLKFGEFKGIRM